MIETAVRERFYLSKGEVNIFIENNNFPQSYIDGIRFLYKQYTKKKVGIVLHDMSWTKRNIQIILFLKAILELLNKAVLILCPEGAEQRWFELFQKYTELDNDMILETTKPFIKKKVIINPAQNLDKFCAHEWSLVIVDDDDQTMTEVLRLPFRAQYRIWSTSVNMKKKLTLFSKIYNWFYPKKSFNEKDFIPNKKQLNDVIDKAILLDAFMEDIVILGNDSNANIEEPQESPKVSRKNKDPTGTKTKRTKRKIDDVLAQSAQNPQVNKKINRDNNETISVMPVSNSATDLSTSTNKNNFNDDPSNNDYTDEVFYKHKLKRNKYVIEDSDEFPELNNEDTTVSSTQSDIHLHYDASEDSDKLYEMDTLPLDHDILQRPGINISVSSIEFENEMNTETSNQINEVISINELKNNKVQSKNYNINELDDGLESFDNEMQSENIPDDFIPESDCINHTSVNEVNLNESYNNTELKHDVDLLVDEEIRCEEIYVEYLPEKHVISQENPAILENYGNPGNTESVLNKTNDVDKSDINEVSLPVSSQSSTIYDKMKELEEKAMKKFKGSILDSLF